MYTIAVPRMCTCTFNHTIIMLGACILCALCVGGSEGDADGEAEGDEEEEESGLVTEVTWVWPECWGVVIMWHCV